MEYKIKVIDGYGFSYCSFGEFVNNEYGENTIDWFEIYDGNNNQIHLCDVDFSKLFDAMAQELGHTPTFEECVRASLDNWDGIWWCGEDETFSEYNNGSSITTKQGIDYLGKTYTSPLKTWCEIKELENQIKKQQEQVEDYIANGFSQEECEGQYNLINKMRIKLKKLQQQ